MRQILVLNDIVPATAKELSALGAGELGVFGIEAGDWKPVGGDTTADIVAFGVGNGTVRPILTPLLTSNVKNCSITVQAYQAAVLPKVATTLASAPTFEDDDAATVKLVFDATELPNDDITEEFTVVGKSASLDALAAAFAAKINAESEAFTASSSSAVLTITAKKTGTMKAIYSFERGPNSALTTAPTFTSVYTAATEGIGTPEQITKWVDAWDEERGFVTTNYRYDTNVTRQSVAGTKYSLVTLTATLDKPTGPTVDTAYLPYEIVFACDVSAGSPTTLVADLKEILDEIFLDIAPAV